MIDPAKQNSQDRAYAHLKDRIATGTYGPNRRIKALDIAEELGVSRTPVKEALGRLEQEGLVRREAGAGYVVQSLSLRDIENLYRVREVLEVEAIREALPRVTVDDIVYLRSKLAHSETLLDEGHHDDFLRANREFNDAITEITDNDVLRQILNGLSTRFWSIGSVIVRRDPGAMREILRENRQVLEALAAKDAAAAESAVRAHVNGASRRIRSFVEREPQHLHMMAA